jgi:hypothetical protein
VQRCYSNTGRLAQAVVSLEAWANAAMTNPDTMAVPPSNPPGLIRLRLPSQPSTTAAPPSHTPSDSSPQLQALEQSLRQLIQSLLETGIMVHDLEEGSGELLFQKMYQNPFQNITSVD